MPAAPKPKRVDSEKRAAATPVARLPFFESDAAIVTAIRAGQHAGGAALYDRYASHVRRVLARVLGPDVEMRDLVQDVFLTAIDSIDKLQQPDALRGWLSTIAMYRGRGEIRRRSRARFFTFFESNDPPEVEAPRTSPEMDEAVRATYAILQKLSADERIAFALRYIEGMELVEVAATCEVSLATIKRRLSRAHRKFCTMAREYAALSEWISKGDS